MSPLEYVLKKYPKCTSSQFEEAFSKLRKSHQNRLIYPQNASKNELKHARKRLIMNVETLLDGKQISPPKGLPLYDYVAFYYPECTYKQFSEAFSKLKKEYKDVLYEIYGANLNNFNFVQNRKVELERARKQLLINIKALTSGEKINPPKGLTLYEYVVFYYPECTKEQFKIGISMLEQESLVALKIVYGEDLEKYISGLDKKTQKCASNARKKLLTKIKNIIKNPMIEKPQEHNEKTEAKAPNECHQYTLFHYLQGVNKKEIDTLTKMLLPAVRCRILYFWGSDYRTPKTNLSETEIHERNATIYLLNLLFISKREIDEEQYAEWYRLSVLFNNPACLNYIEKLYLEYQFLIKAKLGWLTGRIYSVDELAEAFGTDKTYIVKMLDRIIYDLKNVLTQDLEVKQALLK